MSDTEVRTSETVALDRTRLIATRRV